jgi:ribosomal protein S18 acetylase RimI-like enzyme
LNGSPEPFISPFTGKLLPVYIHRDYSSLPIYKRLLNEIRTRILFDVGGLNQQDGWECRNIPIDYVYFQKNDLDQVNTLLCNLFWQIDVSDFLMTPDYCILAKYGKRVIGTVCMSPQGYITYICVANGWNNCGIGKYLLWNCIKIALNGGFDLTLHVQADNDAMILYQEFGFKAEGFIVGFYEKYLPKDSKKCKNALFLRLRIR